MVTTENLDNGQRRTIKGLVDASAPNCAARKEYYELAAKVGYIGAIAYLRGVANANQGTVDLLENFLNGLESA